MNLPKNKSLLKPILVRAAMMDTARKLLSRRSDRFATVFLLHRPGGVHGNVGSPGSEEIEHILLDLKNRSSNLVSLQQIVDAARGRENLPSGSIAFTIDHGYRDQIEVIAPIFVKHQVPLTIFLTTGFINGELWPWDAKITWLIHHSGQSSLEMQFGLHLMQWSMATPQERLGSRRELQAICAAMPGEETEVFLHALASAVGVELPETPPEEFSPASWDQVRQLENAGVRFASHTHTSRILSRLQKAEVYTELHRSLEMIQAETRFALPVLTYPFGITPHFGLREMRLAESAGYSAAFAVGDHYVCLEESSSSSDLHYSLGRFGVPDSDHDALWFAAGLQAMRICWADLFGARSGGGMANHSVDQSPRLKKSGGKIVLRRLLGRLQVALGRFEGLRNIHAERIERLVFVCQGNVCRSPYAEAAARALGFMAISCGVDVRSHAPAELMAVRAALFRGKDISLHMSQSIFDLALESSDCLVVMAPSHLPVTLDAAVGVGCQVTLIGLWRDPVLPEIEDPYGKPLKNHYNCFNDIDQALSGLISELKRQGRIGSYTYEA